ncbi:serine/threonine-protein kinase HAL4/sat4 [Lobulomyces angularis]|nr:serine/threonine-protein kinase HAL4/sat4 [Lobulomyces angularis]
MTSTFSTEIWVSNKAIPSLHKESQGVNSTADSVAANSNNLNQNSSTNTIPKKHNILYRFFHNEEQQQINNSKSQQRQTPFSSIFNLTKDDSDDSDSDIEEKKSSSASSKFLTTSSKKKTNNLPIITKKQPSSNLVNDTPINSINSSQVHTRNNSASTIVCTDDSKIKKPKQPPKLKLNLLHSNLSSTVPKQLHKKNILDNDPDSDMEHEPLSPNFAKRSTSVLFKNLLQKARRPSLNSPVGYSGTSASDSSDGESSTHSVSSTTVHEEHHPTNMFKGLMLGSKYKKSSSSHLLSLAGPPSPSIISMNKIPSVSGETSTESVGSPLVRSNSETSLAEKYGKKEHVLGKGGQAVVHLVSFQNSAKKFAVKEFRKRRKEETQKDYVKKLVSEFCISSSLDSPYIVKTVDLIQDEKSQWCVVMEYCCGGDMYSRIHDGTLTDPNEINCYFKQLVLGVEYLHSMGVAHKDLKPENLLLDNTKRVLKITDFGVSEVFRAPFCSVSQKGKGCIGSGPYIAPEEFGKCEYDSEAVDVWAVGII